MHRKSLEARDDSGASDNEDAGGLKSKLSSSSESLNVVSPVPSCHQQEDQQQQQQQQPEQQQLSPASTPTATTTSSSPQIDINSPPGTPKTSSSYTGSPLQQTAVTPSYHPLMDVANANANVTSRKEFHIIMNTAVAAAAANQDQRNLTQPQQQQQHIMRNVNNNNNKNINGNNLNEAYMKLEQDPDAFRNNSIACLRAKAQEHQARLFNSSLFLQQMRTMSELQNCTNIVNSQQMSHDFMEAMRNGSIENNQKICSIDEYMLLNKCNSNNNNNNNNSNNNNNNNNYRKCEDLLTAVPH